MKLPFFFYVFTEKYQHKYKKSYYECMRHSKNIVIMKILKKILFLGMIIPFNLARNWIL